MEQKFTKSEKGILLPNSGSMQAGGVFTVDHIRDGESLGKTIEKNIVVNEGLDSILDVVFHGSTQITTWYIGLFESNYTPVAGDTIASPGWTESTAYSESTRVEWTEAAASSQSITNSASKATFNINATKTMYGAFLVSDSTKSGTSGTLMAAARFSTSRSVVSGDQLVITYTFSIADA
jgi:hypothetical protein